MPAGLLITSRSASWYKMSSGIGSGSTAISSGAGTMTVISAPVTILWLALSGLEPADTRPASIQR